MQSKDRWTYNRTEKLMGIIALIILSAILFVPLINLGVEALNGEMFTGKTDPIFNMRHAELLMKSVLFSSCSVVIAGTVGYLVAFFLWQRNNRPWRYLKWLIWSLVFIPAYVYGLVWMKGIAWINGLLRMVSSFRIVSSGLVLSTWVQAFT